MEPVGSWSSRGRKNWRTVHGVNDPISPTVTLVVAMRNEEAAIERCLRSIAAQDYPPDRLEVLVYDGGSTDRSVSIAEAVAGGRPGWAIRPNPRRIQAAAWNQEIADASGDVVGILSGHAELDAGYTRNAIRVLRDTGADMVGGPVRTIAEGAIGEGIAVATSTPFGVGGARHHDVSAATDVDTVFMGICRRETWLRFPFAEEMVRNQDDELSYRLLDAGGRIVCDPSIRSWYRSRSTLGGAWHQYFDYGRWKVRVIQAHPRRARARHFAPVALVTWLIGGSLLGVVSGTARAITLLGMATYATATIAAALGNRDRRRPGSALVLALVYPVLHVAYGTGMLRGLWQFRGDWDRPVWAELPVQPGANARTRCRRIPSKGVGEACSSWRVPISWTAELADPQVRRAPADGHQSRCRMRRSSLRSGETLCSLLD